MSAVQGPPGMSLSLTGFPEHFLTAGTTMFRAHSATRSAWWFDNGTGGRFNLLGDRGTCCTATSLDTAVREKVREHVSSDGFVDPVTASEFVVSLVTAPIPYRCAAVNDTDAAKYGLVRELVTMQGYAVPQAWAEFFDTDFDGIFYESAYTTGGPSAYALFGDAGAPSAPGFTEATHMSGADACTALGWTVGAPAESGLDILS